MNAELWLSVVWSAWGFSMGYVFGDKVREMLWRS